MTVGRREIENISILYDLLPFLAVITPLYPHFSPESLIGGLEAKAIHLLALLSHIQHARRIFPRRHGPVQHHRIHFFHAVLIRIDPMDQRNFFSAILDHPKIMGRGGYGAGQHLVG
jgi:hypothetical protein